MKTKERTSAGYENVPGPDELKTMILAIPEAERTLAERSALKTFNTPGMLRRKTDTAKKAA